MPYDNVRVQCGQVWRRVRCFGVADWFGTIRKTEVNKVYDSACGSGSLLLKAEKVLGHNKVRQGFFGQEINITIYNLCRINVFQHDIEFDKFNIAREDTLTAP